MKNDIITNDINENNFIFTNFITGLKEIPYNTMTLLVNDITKNSVNLVYNVNNNNQAIILPLNTIKNISHINKIRTPSSTKKIEENETKSMLLSAIMFGGNPLIQVVGNNSFNSLFNSLSNNYDKVNFNVYYEIIIEVIINNEEKKLIFTSEQSPENFINQIISK